MTVSDVACAPASSSTTPSEPTARSERVNQVSERRNHAFAGAFAGCATATLLHPFDMLRTRFQVQDGPQRATTSQALLTIARTEGVRGLYAGLAPALVGSTVAWSLYFLFYSAAKERYQKLLGKEELGAVQHLAAAAESGALVALLTNPVWLLKTRLQLQIYDNTAGESNKGRRMYQGSVDGIRKILREEGVKGFYKGLGPSLLLVSHGAIQFTAYEELRRGAIRFEWTGSSLTSSLERAQHPLEFAMLGATSKVMAVLLTYPYTVLRSRLQQRPAEGGEGKYRGSWHVANAIFRQEGWRGFYKGFMPHILRVAPSSSITFLVYESTMKLIG